MLDGGDAPALQVSRVSFVVLAPLSFVALVALLAATGRSRMASGAPRVHLRGIARIDAHVARSQGKLVLRGTVTDDMGEPLEHAPATLLAVQLSPSSVEAGAGLALDREPRTHATSSPLPIVPIVPFVPFVVLAPSAPEPCDDIAQAPALDSADRVLVPTDGAARFCLRLAVPAGRYVAHLETRESGFVDSARLDLPIDSALAPVTLRFDPEPSSVSLDDDAIPIDVKASTEDDGVVAPVARLPLTLSNEAGTQLGAATTDAAGHARFVVSGVLFGPAGPGELRVSFAGSAEAGASAHARAVMRRVQVVLEAPDAVAGRLPAPSSETETSVRVVARAACASRGCVAFPTGTVEVGLADGDARGPVGAAPLRSGEARVEAVLSPPLSPPLGAPAEPATDLPLQVRYVPDAPWFEPAAPLLLTEPLRPRSAWSQAALAAAGLCVMAWIAIGRLPRHPSARTLAARARGDGDPEGSAAGVEVLRPDAAGSGGWTGKVVDRHDGHAVAGVRVAIERPGFQHAESLGEATSDASGAFALGPVEVRPGDALVAEGPLHTRVRLPVPGHGELRVALVSRRRALLDRLVAWARRRGRPFDARPDPTPAHVSRVARSGDAVKDWAEAVERAAYSGGAVDAQREADVDRLAPPDAPPTRDSK